LTLKNYTLALIVLSITAIVPAAAADKGEPEVRFGERRSAVVDSIEASIWIDALPQRVWDCAVEDLNGWWPHCYKPGSTVHLEPRAGGRIWEQFDESGQGGVYGHVVYLEEPVVMKADGQWAMPGCAVSGGTWRFEESEGGTVFRLKGEVMGNFGADRGFDGRQQAYVDLLKRLKRFVETGERVDRVAEAAKWKAQAASEGEAQQ